MAEQIKLPSAFKNACKNLDLPAVLVLQYASEQSHTTMSIDVKILGVHRHPKHKIYVEFYSMYVEMMVMDLSGRNHIFRVSQFPHSIVVEKSKYLVRKDKVVLVLHKAKPQEWNSIFYNPPTVVENVKKEFMAFYENLTCFNKQVVFHESWHQAEIFCDNKIDLLHPPAMMRNIIPKMNSLDEIIDSMKSEIRKGGTSNALAYILVTALLAREKERYKNEPHPSSKSPVSEVKKISVEESLRKEERNKDAEEKLMIGYDAINTRMFSDAVTAFQDATTLDEDCHEYYLGLALAYNFLKRFDMVTCPAKSAVELDPTFIDGYVLLSHAHIKLCEPEKAIKYAKMADTIDPDRSVILYRRLWNYKFCSQTLLDQANELKGNKDNFILAYRNGDFKMASSFHRSICENSEDRGKLYLDLIKDFCNNDEFDAAKRTVKELDKRYKNENIYENFFLAIIAYFEDNADDYYKHTMIYNRTFSFPEWFAAGEDYHYDMQAAFNRRDLGDRYIENGDLKKAMDTFSFCLPDNILTLTERMKAYFYYRIGCIEFRQNKVNEAITSLDLSIHKRKDIDGAFALRGKCFLRKGRHEDAIKDFKKAVKINPSESNKESLKKAEKALEEPKGKSNSCSASGEKVANAHKARGKKYINSKRYNCAISAFSEAIKLNKEDSMAYYFRAICHASLREMEQALKDGALAVKFDSTNVKAFVLMGDCNLVLGRAEEAVKLLGKAISLKPKDDKLLFELGKAKALQKSIKEGYSLMEKGEYRSALEPLSSAIAIAINCVPLYMKKAECHIHLKEYKLAAFVAESTICSEKCTDEALYLVGLAEYYQEERKNALKYLNDCLDINPSYAKAKAAIKKLNKVYGKKDAGNRAFTEKRYDDAIKCYRDGLSIDSTHDLLNAIFHFNIGVVQFTREEIGDAVHSLTAAITLKKDYIKAYTKRAECYSKLKLYSKALEDYIQIRSFAPDTRRINELIEDAKKRSETFSNESEERNLEAALATCKKEKGNQYYKEKKYEQALKSYSEAILLNPEDSCFYSNRSACHLMLRNFQDALVDAKEAISKDPKCLKGYLRAGKCHCALGEAEEALRVLEKAKEIDKENKEILESIDNATKLRNALNEALEAAESKNFESAAERYRTASVLAFSNPSLLQKSAECSIRLLDYDRVSELIESASQEIAQSSGMFYIKGLLAYHQDKKDEAFKHLEKAYELDSSNDKLRDLLDRVRLIYKCEEDSLKAYKENDLKRAMDLLHKGIEADPDNYVLQRKFCGRLGDVAMKENMFEDAIEAYSHLLEDENNVSILKKRAECYEKAGELKNAVEDYKKINELTASDRYLKKIKSIEMQILRNSTKDYIQTLRDIKKSYKESTLLK